MFWLMGVARLQEMLQAPLLLRKMIQRQVAVIDAEYRLIQQHEPSRRGSRGAPRRQRALAFLPPAGSADALAAIRRAAGRLEASSPAPITSPGECSLAAGRSRWRRSASWRPVSPPGLPRRRGAAAGAAAAPGEFTALQLAVSSQPGAVVLPADRFK